MAVGRGSILRAVNAGNKPEKSNVKNVEFLTQVTEEMEKAPEVTQEESKKPEISHVSIKDKMPAHLL